MWDLLSGRVVSLVGDSGILRSVVREQKYLVESNSLIVSSGHVYLCDIN